MPKIIIQGISSGIGYALTRHIIKNQSAKIIGTTRKNINEMYSMYKNDLKLTDEKLKERLEIYNLDLKNESEIKDFNKTIKKEHGNKSINLILLTSGILKVPEKTFTKFNMEVVKETFESNFFNHVRFINNCIELLENNDLAPSKIGAISAKVGSIEDNKLGGWYSYRCSKAALNMLFKTISREFENKKQNRIAFVLHPGTVDTNLSKPFSGSVPQTKLFSPEKAAKLMWDNIYAINLKDNGKFINWDGKYLPF